MTQEKTLGKKIDEYFTTHPYLKDLYQEHPLEFDGAARHFYTEGMMEAYHKSEGKKNDFEKFIETKESIGVKMVDLNPNNVSNIFDDGNANWVNEHPHDGLVDTEHGKELLYVLNKGVKQGKKEMLDKVVEWFENTIQLDLDDNCELEWTVPFDNQEEMIEDLKKFLEE